ncbi:hypothetical protein SS1G_08416 [Sclerotinia sclerotiorum 1980 UF-70]|uniref:Uncharacterized protein n=1 Tax=Sclerotinia sclerotiorum (strain ATCC 18683 / 1980 / Ss-1) TaxID=665079 RepID=A7ESW1_SCLS1|nr:hypothetical protein SS1G_08416 [Sclerotinia sclerotiorum 1980 UF-70]EDN92553.1 hypothetical protein SS1G_08416 [Sclerotinia sclerotiorum 1980 UF-70]
MRDVPAASAGSAAMQRRTGGNAPANGTDPPTIGPAPKGTSGLARGAVPRTKFSEAYRSIFTLSQPDLIPLLKHVNCNYLSTKGHSPTVLELKQHAQALVILLKQITLSTRAGVVDNTNLNAFTEIGPRAPSFNENETFDFLNDLNNVYDNNTVHHNLPLPTLLNTLEPQYVEPGTMVNPGQPDHYVDIDICPLHPVDPAPLDGPSLPYATHEALLKHANEVLELIDHEYSAKGGLLGVLPHETGDEDRPLAETTLLGQMILYIQRLVARLHNLERLHANAMDVMKGEAVVPHQALSRVGPDGRSGRELVYPQDRFVLVNAGDDIWQFLNDEFEKKERVDEQIRANHLRLGIEGERLWETKGGKEYSRGITAIDVVTRYYRLRNDSLKTIFVIPAHAEHPGVKVTREMERNPTVVSVVKPIWPERVSVWEKQTRDDLEELRQLRRDNSSLREAAEISNTERAFLLNEVKTQRGNVYRIKEKLKTFTEGPIRDQLSIDLDLRRETLEQDLNDFATQRAELDIRAQELEIHAQTLAAAEQTSTHRRATETQQFAARREALENIYKQRLVDLENDRLAAVESGTRLADEFQNAWTEQLQNTQTLVSFLNSDRAKSLLADNLIPDDIGKRGIRGAQDVVERVLKRLGNPQGEGDKALTINNICML